MCIVDAGDVMLRHHVDPILHTRVKSKAMQTVPDSSDLANVPPDIPASHGPENSVTTDLLDMTGTQHKRLRDAPRRDTTPPKRLEL